MESEEDRKFVITGLVFGTISLFVFGAKSFIFPAMLFTMLLLLWKENLVIRGLKIMSSLKNVAIILCSGLCTLV